MPICAQLRAAVLCGSLTLSACGGAPVIIDDANEIAAHRLERPIIRGAELCIEAFHRHTEYGYEARVNLSMRVDRDGRARFLDTQAPSDRHTSLIFTGSEDCKDQIAAAISDWRYRPFERNGRTVRAEITEQAIVLPAERWRTPARPFPEISTLDSVVITLERVPALVICEGDRSSSYVLQIRGSGDVIITERIYGSEQGGPLLVDGATRHFSIDQRVVEGLVEQFRAAHFFSLNDQYYSGVTDQSVQILTFVSGANRASVEESLGEIAGMPLIVRELQTAVDAAAGLEPLICGPGGIWLN